MRPRPTPRRLGLRLLLAVLLVGLACLTRAEAAEKRNVLLIILDDLPFSALPFHNPPIDFAAEAPETNFARVLRTGTHNRLEARLLATPDGFQGTFRPGPDFTESPLSTDGTSPWAEYTVCAVDTLLAGACDPTFRYLSQEDCLGPSAPAECSDPDFAARRDILPGHGGLQRLANSGMVFTRFYATSAVCLPTRASMMTGLQGERSGAMANGADNRIPGGVIDPNSIMTLPRLLKEQAGYRTALIGKWHVTTPERGVRRPDATPLEDLFTDAIYDNDCCRGSFNRRPLKCLSDGSRNHGLCIAGGAWDDWEGPARLGLEAKCNQPNVPVVNGHTVDCHFSPRGYADMADEYLEKMRLSGENFFLTVAFNATHDPHQSPQRSKSHYEAAPQTERQANFWGLLEETDAAIGRILDALVRTGLDENTVVLFTNDQGPDGIAPRFGDPRLLSGKRTVLEGGIRVPFLAVPPGALQNPAAGPKYVDRLASHVDVYRTVATLAGIDSSDPRVVDTDGVDLSGTILDGDPPTREAVFSRYVGKIAAITEPEFFQSLATSAAGAGRDSQTPSDLLGVCAYAPDPTTLDGNEIQNASGGECPGVVSEGTESKLSHCAVAPRGASVKLCSDDAACAGTMCRITGLRCIPSGSSPQRTAEDLAIRPRCIGGGDCRPNEDCVAVETPCNRCVTPKWKAIREVVHAVPTVRDVVSNPEEDPALDFVGIQAFLQNPPCKISYLRDTMRCLLEKYLDCEVRDPEACENGSFPKMPGPMSIEAFAGCTMPPLDCE